MCALAGPAAIILLPTKQSGGRELKFQFLFANLPLIDRKPVCRLLLSWDGSLPIGSTYHTNVRNSAIWHVCWSFCPKPHSCHTNTPREREGRFRVHLLIPSSTEANSHFPRVYFHKSLTFPIWLPLPFCHLGEPKCWMCALNRTQIIIKTKSVFIISSYKSIYSFSI